MQFIKELQLLFAGIYFEHLDKTAETNFEVWVFIKK